MKIFTPSKISTLQRVPGAKIYPDAAKYNIIGQEYNANKNVQVDPNCNGWTAINKGTKVARVNGIPLNPPLDPTLSGESYSTGGNFGEIYEGVIEIYMDVTDTNPSVILIQKIYI